MDTELGTTVLQLLLVRVKSGDSEALEELFRRMSARMERLARAMLRRFPQVRSREQTGDVVQEAAISLLSSLRTLSFASTREFFGLAAEHIRRRLLDLNRRHAQERRNHAPLAAAGGSELIAATEDDDLERWAELHTAVADLADGPREVFSMRFYHGWQMQEIAEVLQVSTRTATRLWIRARRELTERLRGRWPETTE